MSDLLGGGGGSSLSNSLFWIDQWGNHHSSIASQALSSAQANSFYVGNGLNNAILSINNGPQKTKTNRKLLLLEE